MFAVRGLIPFIGTVNPRASPYIVLIGEKYDDSCIGILSKSSDDLVELCLLGFPGNLDRLGDANTSCTHRSEDDH